MDTGEAITGTDAGALFQSYRWLHDFHVLPRSGGMVEQSARFVAAVDYIAVVTSRAREKQEEVRARKEKLRQQLGRKAGVKRG